MSDVITTDSLFGPELAGLASGNLVEGVVCDLEDHDFVLDPEGVYSGGYDRAEDVSVDAADGDLVCEAAVFEDLGQLDWVREVVVLADGGGDGIKREFLQDLLEELVECYGDGLVEFADCGLYFTPLDQRAVLWSARLFTTARRPTLAYQGLLVSRHLRLSSQLQTRRTLV